MINFKQKGGKVWRTRDLFADIMIWTLQEHRNTYDGVNPDDCPYWFDYKADPKDRRPCMREKFIEYRDYTGYKLANTWFGGWPHFQRLLKCKWFKDGFERWQEELFIALQSEALNKIKEIADTEGATALSAAKYIANKEWERTETARGRPSKAELTGKLKEDAAKASTIQKDYQRMLGNMTVINGGRA